MSSTRPHFWIQLGLLSPDAHVPRCESTLFTSYVRLRTMAWMCLLVAALIATFGRTEWLAYSLLPAVAFGGFTREAKRKADRACSPWNPVHKRPGWLFATIYCLMIVIVWLSNPFTQRGYELNHGLAHGTLRSMVGLAAVAGLAIATIVQVLFFRSLRQMPPGKSATG